MDNQISFPYNFEAYVSKGMDAWQNGNATLAAEYFQKALSIRKSDDVLLFYLMVIPETGMGLEALAWLQQHAPQLWQSRTLRDIDRLFIELLLQVGQLEEAKRQIAKRNHMPDGAQEELLLLLEERLQHLQEDRLKAKKQLHQQLLKEKERVYEGGFLAMNAFLLHSKELPDSEYASLCLSLLEDERIHPLHKTEILEELHKRSVSRDCFVRKDAFSKTVKPAFLLPVGESPFFQNGLQLLQEKEGLSEEIRKGLEQNLFLHVAYYFPFEQEVFQSPEVWLDAVQALQGPQPDEQAAAVRLRDKILEVEQAMNELAKL